MSLADELTQLEQLRDRGSLSADEFQRAKTPKLGCSVRPNPKTGVLRIARSNLVPRQGVKMPP